MFKIIALFLMIGTACGAQVAEPSRPMLQLPNGNLVSEDHPLPVDAQVNIDSITVEAFPVFSDSAGDPATSELDADGRVQVNVNLPGEWAEQTITLVANTAQTITTGITGKRRFIEIKAHNPDKIFWVATTKTAVVEQCRPCNGYVYITLPEGKNVSIIASEAFSLAVTEGGF